MKIAFIDPNDWDYTAETPLKRPLGGSQSSLCYLASALAANGHEVSLINNTSTPGKFAGVHSINRQTEAALPHLQSRDVAIVLNMPVAAELRQRFGVSIPLVFWNQHAPDQPAIAALQNAGEVAAWDAIVVVTQHHADLCAKAFPIPPEKLVIQRHAVAPTIEKAARKPRWYARGEPPTLIYTSTPFRGLDVLLLTFPSLRARIPGIRLRVFSSLAVYQMPASQDPHGFLYDCCRALAGAEYVGSVSQTDLAKEIAAADILAYPNVFPEMACISVMEAMAAGCAVVTSRFGALPETLAGHGFLVDVRGDRLQLAFDFLNITSELITRGAAAPDQIEQHLDRQVAFARSEYTWSHRARQWQEWLATLVAKRRKSAATINV